MSERERWETDLTFSIDRARRAGLDDVVLYIQIAIGEINRLKGHSRDLKQLKEILKRRYP